MYLNCSYLECFEKTHHYLLRGNGQLPNADRHYLAVMVRHPKPAELSMVYVRHNNMIRTHWE